MHAEQPDRLGFAADFSVGAWLVEPSLDRVSRGSTVLRLRPQLIDLLVLLARHAGRTVSKDAILASVWAGQHVAESGMTRCIAELRQALEVDAHKPTMIQTIPKRGYRLVAQVAFLETSEPGGDETTAASDPAIPPPDPASVALDPAILPPDPATRDEAPMEHQPVDALPEPRRGPYPLAVTAWSILGGMLLLASLWAAVAWSRQPVLSGRDTVLLADVANTTGDSAFDGTLRLALAVHLGQAPFLHLLSDDHVRRALTLTGRSASQPVVGPIALEVCRREGAAVLLEASIARMGSRYAVGIEAIACRSGDSIAREMLDVAGKEQVLTALETAAARLRRKLGETRASLRQYDVPIVEATTPSLEALRALSLGDLSRDNARMDDALSFYRRATELDPQFALAWARRGAAALNLGQPEESIPAFRTAYGLRERVSEPERLYILGHYYRAVADEPDKAIETYRMWKRSYPGSAVPPTNLASLYVNVFGRYADGLPEAREAVRLAPYSSIAAKLLVTAYLGSNRMAEARQALRDAAARGVADVVWNELAFQIACADGDAAAMRAHAGWASGNPRDGLVMIEHRARAAAAAGRLREARRLWSEAAGTAAQIASPVKEASVRLKEAETEALLGDARAAPLVAEAALALDPQPRTMLSAAIVYALSGDPERAGRLIDDAVRRTEPGICARPVWLPVGRALVESATGRPDRARETLRQAGRFERGREYGLVPLGVRAVIDAKSGRPNAAAAAFEELLQLRAVVPTSPWVPFARLGAARARRDAGDAAASRAAYDLFLESMKDADADAPLVAAARRERAALQAAAAAPGPAPGSSESSGRPITGTP